MVVQIIGIIVGILITALWIFIPLNKMPQERQISKRVYICSIILGATLCSLLICISEVLWDKITGISNGVVNDVWEAFATSFLRAALIEELVKFVFVKRVLKRHEPVDKLQYMLLAATIGMGYAIVEKLMLSPGAVIISAVFAFHIMFQFIMGGYLYEASNSENVSRKRSMTIKAFLVPFLVHGAWDMALCVVEKYLNSTSEGASILAMLLFFVILVAGIIFEIKVIQYIKKLLSEKGVDRGKIN